MDENLKERLIRVEERAKSNGHRLDDLEQVVNEIKVISNTLVEITSELKHTNENVNEIKEKVEKLETEPGRKWKKSSETFLNALIGAFAAAVAAGLLYLISL